MPRGAEGRAATQYLDNNVDSDGVMQEDEERIPGTVVRLQRYWYDETGAGYWDVEPGDGSYKDSGLTEEEYSEIVKLCADLARTVGCQER